MSGAGCLTIPRVVFNPGGEARVVPLLEAIAIAGGGKGGFQALPEKRPRDRKAYDRQYYLDHRADRIARAVRWKREHPEASARMSRDWRARRAAK